MSNIQEKYSRQLKTSFHQRKRKMSEDWDAEDGTISGGVEDWSKEDDETHEMKSHTKSYREHQYDKNTYTNSRFRNTTNTSYQRYEENVERTENSNSYNDRRNVNYLEIKSRKVGMLIGSKGSNIKSIQSQFNVKINIDKDSNYGQTKVHISGSSTKDVHSAIQHIEKQLADDDRDRYNNSRPLETKMVENDTQNDICTRDNVEEDSSYHVIDWQAEFLKADEQARIKWSKAPKLIKNFYTVAHEVANCSEKEVANLRKENMNIMVEKVLGGKLENDPKPIPNPIWKFEHCFAQYKDILDEIKKQGFEKPSPIQMQAWPVLLEGNDMVGIAQTGTGKTLAFLLPAFIHTEFQPTPRNQRGGPNVLVIAPTRELALQIEKEVRKYSFRGMKSVCIYGGADRREQINLVAQGTEIIIATPGRLNDLVQSGVINLESITYVVLDEADRMLDLGFSPQIKKVLLNIRPDRQTVMTSATWPADVRRLAENYMNQPIQICVGSLDLTAAKTVTQIIEIVQETEKYEMLKAFIINMEPEDKAIVFCGRKAIANSVSSDLGLAGFNVQCIHGSLDQRDREQAIADISSGEARVLIATDVASRGLDIEDVTYVLNYDFPNKNIEEYVHRVGRTGRAGRKGTSISYFTREDWASAKDLIEILEGANQEVHDELRNMALRFQAMRERKATESGGRRGNGGGFRNRNNY